MLHKCRGPTILFALIAAFVLLVPAVVQADVPQTQDVTWATLSDGGTVSPLRGEVTLDKDWLDRWKESSLAALLVVLHRAFDYDNTWDTSRDSFCDVDPPDVLGVYLGDLRRHRNLIQLE